MNILKSLKTFLPERRNLRPFFVIAIPILIQAVMNNTNMVLDIFIVANKPGAAEGLRPYMSWIGIIIGIFLAFAMTGGIIHAQDYAAKKIDKAREVNRLRTLMSLGVAIVFVTCFQVMPSLMAKVFIDSINPTALAAFNSYVRISSFAILFMAVIRTINSAMREIGKPIYTMYLGIMSITLHLVLSISLANTSLGIQGAAIGLLIAKFLEMIGFIIIFKVKGNGISFNPFSIFKISPQIYKQFFSRSIMFTLLIIWYFAAYGKDIVFNDAYPNIVTSSSGENISIAATLSIVSSIQTIFMGAFDSGAGLVGVFVSQELGRGNIKKAKEMSKQVISFSFFTALILSIVLFALSFAVPYMSFLAGGNLLPSDKEKILNYAKFSLWTVCFFYPLWVLFETSMAAVRSGGRVGYVTAIDTGMVCIQLSWAALMAYGFGWNHTLDFPTFFFIFFCSETCYFLLIYLLYFRMDWAKNITHEYEKKKNKK